MRICVARDVANIGLETAQKSLTHVGMQIAVRAASDEVLAAENPFLEYALFQRLLQSLGNRFEVVAGFVFDAALGMAAVVSGITVAAALAGERLKQALALGQFAEAKIEDAGPVTVDQHDAQPRKRAQQVGQRA